MHQRVSRATRYCLLAVSAGLLLAGCGSKQKSAEEAEAPSVESPYSSGTRPEVKVVLPRESEMHALSMGRSGRSIRIGDAEDRVFSIFVKPNRASDFFEEPPIQGDEYLSRGWQSQAESFGGIFLRGQLILGQYMVEKLPADSIEELMMEVSRDQGDLSYEEVPGKYGRYRFWQSGSDRLMAVVTTDVKGQSSFTLVLGISNVMDALRMNVDGARQDLMSATQLLDQAQSQK